MFPATISLTVGAATKVLNRIQGGAGHSSEYLLKEGTGEYRMKVRHSQEKNTIRGEKMDRHNVELSYTVYGVEPADGHTIVASTTIRNPEKVTGASVTDLSGALGAFVSSKASDLLGWVS